MSALHCAFCGRSREEVSHLALAPKPLAGVRVAICYDCAASATEAMLGELLDADRAVAESAG